MRHYAKFGGADASTAANMTNYNGLGFRLNQLFRYYTLSKLYIPNSERMIDLVYTLLGLVRGIFHNIYVFAF